MQQLILERTVYLQNQFEPMPLPQIAMAGRSNVGKSSLINCLAGRKKLAKISSTPGKTRSINYYRVEPALFYIVDLPGYGYARVSKKQRNQWARLIEEYIINNKFLCAITVLLDSRLKPQQADMELTNWLEELNIKIIPVLTKSDKCKQREQNLVARQWQQILGLEKPPLAVSSKTGKNIKKLWDIFLQSDE